MPSTELKCTLCNNLALGSGALRRDAQLGHLLQISVVYKFGGSSVADAERMREVAEILASFPDQLPCVVMSAMGKTTNLLLEAGELAIERGPESVPSLKALRQIKELHRDTCTELELPTETVAVVERLLTELQQLLTGMAIMQVRARLPCLASSWRRPPLLATAPLDRWRRHAGGTSAGDDATRQGFTRVVW